MNPFYKFITVDIGSYGRHSNSGIFENSLFYNEYIKRKSLLPPKPLPGITELVPYVILIGDEGFGLQTYLLRPFPRSAVLHDEIKRKFNKRLCRARRVVENVFGILTQKWRIFLRPIESDIQTTVHVVKAACCLHNFIKMKQNTTVVNDIENPHDIIHRLTSTRPTNRRSSTTAFEVREKFVNYFNQ